ncbi:MULTISPECIES: hypothetical protein [Bacillaceae]|uniref:hypothetical protein n=1 Tax=Bacillaceae TaxID=186817 RepID=UPI00313E4493
MRVGKCITTYTGIEFYPLDPRVQEVSTRDIAHALSLLCRANGHYRHFYSVGQHSLNCAKEARFRGYSERLQLACLLHDASEAYISDITRPVKQELSQYLEMEQRLQQFIYTVYGLSDLTQYECSLIKEIDDDMLAYEMRLLLHSHEVCKGELIGQHNFQFVMMKEVEDEFVRLVKELQNKLSLTSTMESLSTP